MKKQILKMAASVVVLGALACSCQEEKNIETGALEPGVVALMMGESTTRAETGSTVQVNTYNVGTDSKGTDLILEEVVTEMEAPYVEEPETRGTPAYTQNVTSVFGHSFFGVIYGPNGQVVGDGAFDHMTAVTDKSVWRRVIGFNPWTQGGDPLYFFLRMPEAPSGLSNLQYSYANGSIDFNYTTPSTAAKQQDILFAARQLSEATYTSESKSKGGSPVLFRHALTGVKFAIGNNTTQADNRQPASTQTFITKVSITGLYSSGKAHFVPTGTENASQEDNINEFTSKDSFTWSDYSGKTAVYEQSFGVDDIQDYAQGEGDQIGAPASFYAAGEERNLNKADGSLTFWFIPQNITADLKITVTFKIWDGLKPGGGEMGEEETLVLNLGSIIQGQTDREGYTNKVWKAGQLRTFSLKPNLVDVDITDDVDGYTKSNVAIRNTGNVDAFMRAHIVANWFGTMDNGTDGIALGYDGQNSDNYVKSWQLPLGATTDNYNGVFTNLPGNDWVLATDGYYYYTKKVAPGALTGSALFNTYSLATQNVPQIWYLDSSRKQFTNVRLVMEIPVQAIMAKSEYSYTQAWAEAGVTVTPYTPTP